MASIDFAKYSKGQIGVLGSVHFDKENRLKLEHSNKDINKELTESNFMIGTNSYQESKERLDERTKAVDEVMPPQRVKSDRVVCDVAYIVCPSAIEDKKHFFEMSYQWLEDKFGKENVHGGFVHYDEVHLYRDSRVRDENDNQAWKMSLEHMHVMLSPYTQEKGINSKAFNTRTMFKEAQVEFDNMVYQEFGIHYNTNEESLGLEVELLKEVSSKLHEREATVMTLELENQTLQAQNENLKEQLKVMEEILPIRKELKKINVPYLSGNSAEKFEAYTSKGIFSKPLEVYEAKEIESFVNSANELNSKNAALNKELRTMSYELDRTTDMYNRLLSVDVNKNYKELEDKASMLTIKYSQEKSRADELAEDLTKFRSKLETSEKALTWYRNAFEKVISYIDKFTIDGLNCVQDFINKKMRYQEDKDVVNEIADNVREEEAIAERSHSRGGMER